MMPTEQPISWFKYYPDHGQQSCQWSVRSFDGPLRGYWHPTTGHTYWYTYGRFFQYYDCMDF